MYFNQFIVAGTIVFGCFNSLLTKFQDNQCVANCDNPDASTHKHFEQPAIQTLQMFVGELGIYIVYVALNQRSKRSQYTPVDAQNADSDVAKSIILAIPSVCDMLATTFMNVGLVYTPVSIYQMTRGAVILSVALLSVLFLRRRIRKLEWISLILVTFGIAVVGYSGSSSSGAPEDAAKIALGITLILFAVTFQAVQFVVEEKILSYYLFMPMQLVYTEGFFGVTILVAALIILNFAAGLIEDPAAFKESPFNLSQSIKETFSSWNILGTSLLIMVCISAFNFCGISLTHLLSATARSTVDSCRTLLVWVIAMLMGWETFKPLQALGFAILLFGTLSFNGVLQPEEWLWVPAWLKDEEHRDERVIDVVDEPIERM